MYSPLPKFELPSSEESVTAPTFEVISHAAPIPVKNCHAAVMVSYNAPNKIFHGICHSQPLLSFLPPSHCGLVRAQIPILLSPIIFLVALQERTNALTTLLANKIHHISSYLPQKMKIADIDPHPANSYFPDATPSPEYIQLHNRVRTLPPTATYRRRLLPPT